MSESEFGRKSYDRLKFDNNFICRALRKFAGGDNNFICRALRKFAGGYEISQPLRNFFAKVAKIFIGLRKFPAFFVFVFFSSFSCLIYLKTASQH